MYHWDDLYEQALFMKLQAKGNLKLVDIDADKTSGSGKSTFCLQICVGVQLPRELGGIDKHAVFISTEIGKSLIAPFRQNGVHFLR